jgi:hypothetical protein
VSLSLSDAIGSEILNSFSIVKCEEEDKGSNSSEIHTLINTVNKQKMATKYKKVFFSLL